MKQKNYEYEEDLDIFYINNNPLREKVEGSLTFGNIVVDIGGEGKVLGVEVDSASKFFKFSYEQLKNLKVAEVQVVKIGNMITFGIVIETEMKEYTFQFGITQDNKIPIAAY